MVLYGFQAECIKSHGPKNHIVVFKIYMNYLCRIYLGPVVQSIISLTSSLRGQIVKCFTIL